MKHQLTFRRLQLVNIIIKLVKYDLNSGVKYYPNQPGGVYSVKLTLRMLRSIVDLKEYNNARKNRLTLLREHYMEEIKEVYERV